MYETYTQFLDETLGKWLNVNLIDQIILKLEWQKLLKVMSFRITTWNCLLTRKKAHNPQIVSNNPQIGGLNRGYSRIDGRYDVWIGNDNQIPNKYATYKYEDKSFVFAIYKTTNAQLGRDSRFIGYFVYCVLLRAKVEHRCQGNENTGTKYHFQQWKLPFRIKALQEVFQGGSRGKLAPKILLPITENLKIVYLLFQD